MAQEQVDQEHMAQGQVDQEDLARRRLEVSQRRRHPAQQQHSPRARWPGQGDQSKLSPETRQKNQDEAARQRHKVLNTPVATGFSAAHKEPEPEPEPPDCAICLEPLDSSTRRVVAGCPGGHALHQDCADGWRQESSKCPTCRKEMLEIRPTCRGM